MLSICVTIKNRSHVQLGEHELFLFPNCVKSIAEAMPSDVDCELVVTDWQSDDWPLNQWLHAAASPISVTLVSVKGKFSRGDGLNRAAEAAKGDILFFLDVDMLVTAEVLEKGLVAVRQGKAYFPIVYSFTNPAHTDGEWRRSGYGICMMSRSTFNQTTGWPDFKSWGEEDKLMFRKISSFQDVVRKEQPGLEHQWHPNEVAWKNRYGEPAPQDESNPDRVRQRAKQLELQRIESSKWDLAQMIPPGATFILVDEGRFGSDPLPQRFVIPFLERDGQYNGAPSDDDTAIAEFDRLRCDGASFIVFPWISFWWLYLYSGFYRHLNTNYPTILENELLVVFDLR